MSSAEAREPIRVSREEDLAEHLGDETKEGQEALTQLKADSRVIARVTDGIYRLPGSALRELIANAWDADAQNVSIDTDAPRFSRITIRDDGEGMDNETLAHVINSIGGSAKRRKEGQKLGIASSESPDTTPGGRLFIGKIGIGLFSVSQLTRRFTIVTKRRGAAYRLIAHVSLRQHAEDGSSETREVDDNDDFISGEVRIVRERAADPSAHGTDIILDSIKPAARETLRSADRWRAIDEAALARREQGIEGDGAFLDAPTFHAGWIAGSLSDDGETPKLSRRPAYPWSENTRPEERMALLVDGVSDQTGRIERPDLATTLDYYLSMIWQLGLSVPVPYVEKHPFDLTGSDRIRLYWLANEVRQQASELDIGERETVRDAVARWSKGRHLLKDGTGTATPMRVLVDSIELKRPISFRFVSSSMRGLDRSILTVGSYTPNLSRVPFELRGGKLSFEAYLFWTGRIIPKENNGALVRIRGASGANFDETFFKYQISEQTRLKQITAELFVREGLDAALNIDRESFNFSHPHFRLTASWMHRALRQLTNRHKEISSRNLAGRKGVDAEIRRSQLEDFADAVWRRRQGDEPPPEVEIASNTHRAREARGEGIISLTAAAIPQLSTSRTEDAIVRRAQAEALLKVLAAFGILEDRPYVEQERLVAAIFSVFYPQ